MNKSYILILSISLLITSSSIHAQSFGLFLGLSTPSEQINNVYNSDFLTAPDFIGRLKRDAASVGYQGGARIRFGLSDDIVFSGGVSITRFPVSKIRVSVPNLSQQDSLVAELSTVQNIIPIAAGLNYYLLRKTVSIYGTGEITYNYISNTIDATFKGTPFPIAQSSIYNRVGVGLGVGIDLNLKLLTLNLESKYNLLNFIGKESGNEPTKSFISVSLGVYLGVL
ncbi:MAG: outer membrane beta-barrel protein [Ignavibacteria bacterium]|nr:outer membrane beta-barrel protein [Ignavibacteria bacterium]